MDKNEINDIENSLYELEDNYDLAEWGRRIIPELIKEIKRLNEDISGLKDIINRMHKEES
jgi:phosphoenolpyruvate carboxylase